MKKRLQIAIYLLLLCACYTGNAVRFDRLSVRDGLSSGLVNNIIQDKKGFIWIATEDGLNRYDGYKFTIYKPQKNDSSSISSNIIKTVYEDSEGLLWIGTVGGGLNCFNPATERFISFQHDVHDPNSISDNNVYAIFEDSRKNLWVGTFGGGLNKFNKRTKSFARYRHDAINQHSISGDAIRAIAEDKKGQLWIGVDEGGLDCFDQKTGRFRHYTTQNSKLSSNVLLSVFIDKKGAIWSGTWAGGINKLNPETEQISSFTHNPASNNSLANNENFAFVQDHLNRLWITTRSGLDCYDESKKQFIHFTNNTADDASLSDNITTSVCIDYSGVLWIGTWGSGICKLDLHAKGFSHIKNKINDPNSLVANNIFALYEDSDDVIWIGTKNSGIDSYNPKTKKFRHFLHQPSNNKSLSFNVVRAICDAEPGYLWVGTDGGGLNKMNKATGECERFFASEKSTGLSNNSIYTLLFEPEKKLLWIGTYGGGLNCLDVNTKQFTKYAVNHYNQMKNVVLALARDGSNRLWVATGGMGLLYFNEDRQMFFSYKDFVSNKEVLSSQVINTLLSDKNGNLWIGTAGAGLYRLDLRGGLLTNYDVSNGLPNDVVVSICQDLKHNMWIGTNNGISMYDPFSEIFRNYTTSDGLQDVVFNQNVSLLSRSGNVYFGGVNGINVWNPDSITVNQKQPNVCLTDFKIFNKSVKPGNGIAQSISVSRSLNLDYKKNVITIEFAALHYASSNKNKYAYKLEGFENKWNYTTAERRFATYTNLPGGTYTFKVKASNNDGVWNNEGVSLKINIIPPFWRTVYFYIILALLLIGVIYVAYRYRIRQFNRKQEELEKKVLSRTEELNIQKQELILINEQLNQQTEELKVQGDSLREINNVLSDQAKQLRFKSEMLIATNEEIKSKNKLVTESIRYAKRIQDSILPSSQQLDGHFMEYFIMYKPRDIVSGDFYWFAQPSEDEWGRPVENIVIAAVDCTGHGVPGAFMSIIGNTQLNQIVLNKGILKPGDILTELNNGIINALSAQETSSDYSDDGMDISICTINPASGILQCGAAMQKIYFVSKKNGLSVIDGDIYSIGELFSILKKPTYTTVTMEYEPGDMLYLFSDGITDQFGGKNHQKFQESQFRDLILSIYSQPAQRQKEIIYQTFEDWKTNESQLDDVMVLGFRLK